MNFDFYKYHALGNDYIVIDPKQEQVPLTPERIQMICHRHFGIGSDGILYGPFFQNDIIEFRIFNPDGSEAEKSGNGIRIFSRYLLDRGYVTAKKFSLKTVGGIVGVEILDETGREIRVDMGPVTFDSPAIPVAGPRREMIDQPLSVKGRTFQITCLTIGNPHCVIFDQNFSKNTVLTWGPLLENHDAFPKRVNVQFVRILDRKKIEIGIWERGAGYTLASGSSSSAAAKAAYRLGMVEQEVDVLMPGGIVHVVIQANGHVWLTGAVDQVAKGFFCQDLQEKLAAL